jgi:integrase
MHLRKKRLNDITPQNLENMYQSLLDGDSPSGKMLSGTYVSGIAATLHTLFRDCIREGLLMNNPCDIARAPTVDTPERKALKADSIIELIEQLDPAQPTQLCLLLMVKTGMRRGEAHGLSWGDITDNAIRITHSYDDAGNLKGTKTKKSNREIPLTDSVRADLEIRRQQMLQDLVQTGHRARIRPDMPVICNELRERILPHATTRWFARNRARLGLDGWTPHEMRHSYLSELARRGVPVKILQELAGHENYQTTMNIYVHVSEEDKKNAIKVVDW